MTTSKTLSAKLWCAAIAAALIAVQVGAARAQTIIRTAMLPQAPPPMSPMGIWSGNSFITLDSYSSGMPILHLHDQSGAEVREVDLQIPGVQYFTVLYDRFVRSADGYLAVSGRAYGGNDNSTLFLAVIPPDGAKQLVVRTDPYVPYALVFAADGTIWAAGREKGPPERDQEPRANYFLIRRFDRNGKLLGGSLPRITFPGPEVPVEGSFLVASKDRVGWFAPRAHRYIEFSLDGKQLATYPLNLSMAGVSGLALCDDNTLWASVNVSQDTSKQGGAPRTILMSLDRSRGILSGGKAQPYAFLYGCTGTTLVTSGRNFQELRWLATR